MIVTSYHYSHDKLKNHTFTP